MKQQRSVDRVYARIKSMVVEYEIPPGQQIHIEALANQLNVSVTPVREALNRLLIDGLIFRGEGRGFFNRHIDHSELRDLFQLRSALAISAIHIVLNTQLADSIEQMLDQADVADCDSPAKSSLKICKLMIDATGNREMIKIFDNISSRIKYIWDVYAGTERGKSAIVTYRSDLRQALLDRKLELSTSIVYAHIASQIDELESLIDLSTDQALGRSVGNPQPLGRLSRKLERFAVPAN